jgi:hypothetical protein
MVLHTTGGTSGSDSTSEHTGRRQGLAGTSSGAHASSEVGAVACIAGGLQHVRHRGKRGLDCAVEPLLLQGVQQVR